MLSDSSSSPFSLRQLLRKGMATAIPSQMFMVSGPSKSDGVALTFDDGPHPEHTPPLLDRLAARGIRGTFFILGRQAARHPDIVKRIAAEGHDIGHHSYSHGDPETTSAWDLVLEARHTAKLLEKMVGREPRLFRPPHGKLTPSKTLGLWGVRQKIVLWNQDPKDFSCGSTQALSAWFEGRSLSGGDVVLLHDVHPFAAGAVDIIADKVAAAGLRFCPVSAWIGA